MDGTNPRCVTIVDRSYPPNRSITGESACDLARFLIEQYDIDVHIVHLDTDYGGGSDPVQPVGTVHKLPSFYNGKDKLKRFRASLQEGKALIKKAIEINRGPIICMTSPPLLNYWASKLIPVDRPWFLWSMDLFPDAFISSRLSSKWNPIYRYFDKVTYRRAPERLIALGPLQAEYIQEKYKKNIESITLPCGIMLSNLDKVDLPVSLPKWKEEYSDKIIFGYCGNVGEAHSPEFLKACLDQIDPEKHHFILVAYGKHSEDILAYANGKPGVTILNHVPREQLQYIDIHVVSLKEDWVHVCVPSKLVSAVYMESNFLFCGIAACDNWHLMQDSGWLVTDDDQMIDQVKTFFKTINKDELAKAKERATLRSGKLVDRSRKAYNEIALAILEYQKIENEK